MREVFEVARILRIDAPCGGYAHHDGSKAALVELSGKTDAPDAAIVAKDIAMHIVASARRLCAKKILIRQLSRKSRSILMEAARKEGKPENILAKMIEGRLHAFSVLACFWNSRL